MAVDGRGAPYKLVITSPIWVQAMVVGFVVTEPALAEYVAKKGVRVLIAKWRE